MDDIDTLAVELLGIEHLRDHQRSAIAAVVGGDDTLVVAPTGSGKSAIYQLAAAVLPGATIVVSPLLALHADQRSSIEASGLVPGTSLDGDSSADQRVAVTTALAEGRLEYLLVTPETLLAEDTLRALDDVEVSLLVIDEAHCIAIDGHGFRPEYLLLGEARRRLGRPRTLALSASVDPHVRDEIATSLGLGDPTTIVTDLRRPELHLSLRRHPSRSRARTAMLAELAAEDAKTLVYAPTRRSCDEIAGYLGEVGRPARSFHGGRTAKERAAVLDHLRSVPDAVVAATTAFGLGIDIPDLRVVVHLDLPESLVTYYQEIGRAGRDGEPARAIAFASTRKRSRRAFAGGVRPTDPADCAVVYVAVADGASSRRAVARRTGIATGRAVRALHVLGELGAVRLVPRIEITGRHPTPEEVEQTCRRREEYSRSLGDGVSRYLSVERCRWSQLLAVFGQTAPPCGHCDICDDAPADETTQEALVGRDVVHAEFGPGRIAAVDDDVATVTFDAVGAKDLHLPTTLDAGLLELDGGGSRCGGGPTGEGEPA